MLKCMFEFLSVTILKHKAINGKKRETKKSHSFPCNYKIPYVLNVQINQVCPGNRKKVLYITYVCKGIYCKKSAYMIMGVSKAGIYRSVQKSRNMCRI